MIKSILTIAALLTLNVSALAAVPSTDLSSRAALSTEMGSTAVAACSTLLRHCFVSSKPEQPNCFAAAALHPWCNSHPLNDVMKRRVALERFASLNIALRSCLDNVDAATGSSLMNKNSGLSDSQANSMIAGISGNLQTCEEIARSANIEQNEVN